MKGQGAGGLFLVETLRGNVVDGMYMLYDAQPGVTSFAHPSPHAKGR